MPSEDNWGSDHPADADDLVWWVVLGSRIYMDGPSDSLEEAAALLEKRSNEQWGTRAQWSLLRIRRAWGWEHLTGT